MAVEQSTARGAEQTRIHNIGYRNYDGPRLGRAYARRSLYSQSLRGAYGLGRSVKSKVLPMLLFVVMCAPALIMVAVAVATKAKDLPVEYTRYAIIMQAIIGLYVASQAPQSVSRDLRFKTVPLYFSRPIETADSSAPSTRRWPRRCSFLTAAPLLVLYVGALLAKLDFEHQTKGFAQALVSVALLSLLFAGISLSSRRRRPGADSGSRRSSRPDHLLRSGLHHPGHRRRAVGRLQRHRLDGAVLARHAHRRCADGLPGCDLLYPGGHGPSPHRASSISSSSWDWSRAATDC